MVHKQIEECHKSKSCVHVEFSTNMNLNNYTDFKNEIENNSQYKLQVKGEGTAPDQLFQNAHVQKQIQYFKDTKNFGGLFLFLSAQSINNLNFVLNTEDTLGGMLTEHVPVEQLLNVEMLKAMVEDSGVGMMLAPFEMIGPLLKLLKRCDLQETSFYVKLD